MGPALVICRFRFCALAALAALAVVAPAPRASNCFAAEYLVADQVGNRVVAFEATTGAYLRTVWSTNDTVQPSALAFGPGGDLFIANRLSGDVLRIAAANLGMTNAPAPAFLQNVFYPGSLAYHAGTDTLLVGEFGIFPEGPLGDEIFVYNGAAVKQATLTLPPVGIAGLAFNAAGDLLASGFITDEFGSGRVYRFNGPPSWASQGIFAPTPPDPTELLQGAAGIALNSNGDIFVAGLVTFNAGNVVKFPAVPGPAVGAAEQVGPLIPFPSGLLRIDDNQLLVTSLGFGPTSGTVFRFNSNTGARSTLLAGDFNNDGSVNGADFEKWKSAFGVNGDADADFDGDSDGDDFLAWQRGLGNHGAPGLFSPSAVVLYNPPTAGAAPEPTSALLLALSCLAHSAARRRTRVRP